MRPLVSHTLVGAVVAAVVAGITVGIMYSQCDKEPQPTPTPPSQPTPPPPPPPTMAPTSSTPPPPLIDPMRPAYHYTPKIGWVNDPNGLVYYKGEYHLFYQYDFESIKHGNMSWGHAVSTDMVHWTELPLAISYTDEEQIFSGSAVVDSTCSSGLCASRDTPVLIATYTSYKQHVETEGKWKDRHIQSQHIASSTDLGRTWTKYKNNPVLDRNEAEFRDPRVQRLEDGSWLLLVQMSELHQLQFYKSTDLIHWGEPISTFGPTGIVEGVWECPDMFPLAVDGDPKNIKWVLIININPGNRIIGSAGQIFIGDFDGTSFKNDGDYDWLDWGMDNYATITWDNAPNGERYSIGWMSNWAYTELTPTTSSTKFRNTFTTPRKLQLKTIGGKVRLTQMPVNYLDAIRLGPVLQADKVTVKDAVHGDNIRGRAVDIEVVFTNVDATEFGVKVHAGEGQETLVGFEVATKRAFVDRTKSGKVDFHEKFADSRHWAPFELQDAKTLKLRVLVDHGSVEAFFGEGEIAITDVVFPDPSKDSIQFYAKGGSVVIDSYSVWQMDKTNNLS
ncbi:Levanase [Frankliniella fusca]|uniref:Levanase n=1 Tax=Frankliniella fusca TaxID=407009 RepID=A0AAE1GQ96_9NEOP|nr:Levanase [Frankliniella fusca]